MHVLRGTVSTLSMPMSSGTACIDTRSCHRVRTSLCHRLGPSGSRDANRVTACDTRGCCFFWYYCTDTSDPEGGGKGAISGDAPATGITGAHGKGTRCEDSGDSSMLGDERSCCCSTGDGAGRGACKGFSDASPVDGDGCCPARRSPAALPIAGVRH